MSELSELTGAGKGGVFASHILSPPRLMEFAEAEEEAGAQYLRRVVKSSMALPAADRQVLQQRAVDNLRNNPFAYGSPAFDQWALSMGALPFLTWLLLRIRHPRMSLGEAADLLNGEDYAVKVDAVWSIWGYQRRKKTSTPPVRVPVSPAGDSPTPCPMEPMSAQMPLNLQADRAQAGPAATRGTAGAGASVGPSTGGEFSSDWSGPHPEGSD